LVAGVDQDLVDILTLCMLIFDLPSKDVQI